MPAPVGCRHRGGVQERRHAGEEDLEHGDVEEECQAGVLAEVVRRAEPCQLCPEGVEHRDRAAVEDERVGRCPPAA
jgi:hypothetical protein